MALGISSSPGCLCLQVVEVDELEQLLPRYRCPIAHPGTSRIRQPEDWEDSDCLVPGIEQQHAGEAGDSSVPNDD